MKTKTVAAALNFVLVLFSLQAAAFAASGNASFSISGGGSYSIGSTISSTLYETSPTDPVNVVQADLTYDQNQLQLISIDTSQSSFSGKLAESGGSGSIRIVRYTLQTDLTGQAQIGTVSFKVLADTGSAALNFASSSHIVSQGQDIWDKNTAGATYTFTPPPVTSAGPASAWPLAQQPKPVVFPPPAETKKPVDSVLANTSKLPPKAAAAPYQHNSRSWWLFIGLGALIAAGLVARLFNLHKKIRAKSAGVFLMKALKRAV